MAPPAGTTSTLALVAGCVSQILDFWQKWRVYAIYLPSGEIATSPLWPLIVSLSNLSGDAARALSPALALSPPFMAELLDNFQKITNAAASAVTRAARNTIVLFLKPVASPCRPDRASILSPADAAFFSIRRLGVDSMGFVANSLETPAALYDAPIKEAPSRLV